MNLFDYWFNKTAKEKDIEKKRRSLNPYNYGHAASFTGIPFAGSITRELLFKNREKRIGPGRL